jgi:cation:H+ antiporter
VIQKELPILALITLFSLWLIQDGELTRLDAMLLLGVFFGVMGWTIRQGLNNRSDSLEKEMETELESHAMPLKHAVLWLIVGLVLLIVSSRMLVSGAVAIAQSLGISDLVIGLTIVAIGTSLPELASSIAAAKKGEDDIAVGNIIGSNLFNTTAVVGLAGAIQPMSIPADIISRDWPLMAALTVALFAMGYTTNGHGRINRLEGAILVAVFAGYTSYLAYSVMAA